MMDIQIFESIVEKQRAFFKSGATLAVDFRKQQLLRLKAAIKAAEAEILGALRADLGKSSFEAYASEVGFLYREIDHTLASLTDWASVKKVPAVGGTPGETCAIYAQPKGVVLIISPWNYPFNLVISPLLAALAAGNCVVIKPSELAKHTAAVLSKLMAEIYPEHYCTVVTGGQDETSALLKIKFSHIFFTGSVPVGRIVMLAAAEQLTPVTLELGGKSPCLVDDSVDIAVAARRIVWGKFYNAGQTCVAPDYLLVPRSIKPAMIRAIGAEISNFFGEDPKASPDLGRIINARHYDRLLALISGKVVVGGQGDRDALYLAPTVIDDVSMADKVMENEIFGPILPVLAYDNLDEALNLIAQRPNPLALYLFTQNPAVEERVVREVPYGGGCINNCLLHLGNPWLPFGGIGDSGIGAYHGEDGFNTFSHRKSVLRSDLVKDGDFRYPPYGERFVDLKKILQ